MRIARLPLVAVAFASFACTMNNGPVEEDPAVTIVGNDESQLPIDPTRLPTCSPQRFDFVIAPGDYRTCASFVRSSVRGRWTAFSTFPSMPAAIRDKHCAALWTPEPSACPTAHTSDLSLNCNESLTLTQRSTACARLGSAGGPACNTAPTVMMNNTASVKPTDIELACPTDPTGGRVLVPNIDLQYARTYSGGCTSCGALSGGTLVLTSPKPWAFVTFYDNSTGTPTPRLIGFDNVTGPLTYNVSAYSPSGPVVVSY